ncbi:CD3324 family protein [Paenibacillus sp. SYP-B4298]|uniref:CD3324 family protein n=1 Tax=Paenibacillus sp. SYP-B4298 TaxID=2996034 RepID=UPI003FA7236B
MEQDYLTERIFEVSKFVIGALQSIHLFTEEGAKSMKYISASQILPEYLLHELQKYVHGSIVYVPSPEGSRKKWGEASGQREYFQKRNLEIKQLFRMGHSIDQLMCSYCLSEDSIKKIVYKKDK